MRVWRACWVCAVAARRNRVRVGSHALQDCDRWKGRTPCAPSLLTPPQPSLYQSRGQSSQIAARAESPHSLPSPDEGTTVRQGVSEAGATFPAQAWTGRRAFLPSPPVSLSPAGRERGNALQGALPCAPTPLSHAVGEGLGVRAKKRARPAHSELKRCTLIRVRVGGMSHCKDTYQSRVQSL